MRKYCPLIYAGYYCTFRYEIMNVKNMFSYVMDLLFKYGYQLMMAMETTQPLIKLLEVVSDISDQ